MMGGGGSRVRLRVSQPSTGETPRLALLRNIVVLGAARRRSGAADVLFITENLIVSITTRFQLVLRSFSFIF